MASYQWQIIAEYGTIDPVAIAEQIAERRRRELVEAIFSIHPDDTPVRHRIA